MKAGILNWEKCEKDKRTISREEKAKREKKKKLENVKKIE